MRLFIAALVLSIPTAALAQVDSRKVRVAFDVSTCSKDSFCPSEHVAGEGGLWASSTSGSTIMYAEVELKNGASATVEILYKDGDEATFHYWESVNDALSFFGSTTQGGLTAPPVQGEWTHGAQFSFEVDDGDRFRFIENGVIEPVIRDPSRPNPGTGGGGGGGGGGVVVIHDSGGCGGSEPPPDDETYGDSGCEGDTTTDDPYDDSSSSGCEGDTSTDSTTSSGGCEGDTGDSSPSSSGGCEGDSGSSSSSSSGCEGDSYARNVEKRRATNSMFRLAWPIVLVGAINRGLRARAAKKTQPPPSR